MKVPLNKFIIVTLIVIPCLLSLEYILQSKVIALDYYKLHYSEMFKPKVKANIIIVGASHGTHGIDPRFLETKDHAVYNFCFNGSSPAFTMKWYRLLSKEYPKPTTVIYEVNWFMFDSTWLWRRIEQDSRYMPLNKVLDLVVDPSVDKNLLLRNRMLLFSVDRAYTLFTSDALSRRFNFNARYDHYYNGYVPLKSRLLSKSVEKRDAANSSTEILAFEQLLDTFKKNKIKVIFVQAPEYIPGRASCSFKTGNALIEGIAAKRAIPFLNYNSSLMTSINFNPDLYYDWGHLNETGSEIFSAMLARDLSKLE